MVNEENPAVETAVENPENNLNSVDEIPDSMWINNSYDKLRDNWSEIWNNINVVSSDQGGKITFYNVTASRDMPKFNIEKNDMFNEVIISPQSPYFFTQKNEGDEYVKYLLF